MGEGHQEVMRLAGSKVRISPVWLTLGITGCEPGVFLVGMETPPQLWWGEKEVT